VIIIITNEIKTLLQDVYKFNYDTSIKLSTRTQILTKTLGGYKKHKIPLVELWPKLFYVQHTNVFCRS